MDRPDLTYTVERRTSKPAQEIRFIRLQTVLNICGMSRTSVNEAIKKGNFPAPVKLCGRSTAWVESEVQLWVQS